MSFAMSSCAKTTKMPNSRPSLCSLSILCISWLKRRYVLGYFVRCFLFKKCCYTRIVFSPFSKQTCTECMVVWPSPFKSLHRSRTTKIAESLRMYSALLFQKLVYARVMFSLFWTGTVHEDVLAASSLWSELHLLYLTIDTEFLNVLCAAVSKANRHARYDCSLVERHCI
jgi:hypothetical protein